MMAIRSRSLKPPPMAAIALALLAPTLAYADQPQERWHMSKDLRIIATEFNFSPNRIKVDAGKPFHLIIDNSKGETEHAITIPALGKRIMAASGSEGSDRIVFDHPGEYEFVCDLPGHTEGGMKGKFIVSPGDDIGASLSNTGQ